MEINNHEERNQELLMLSVPTQPDTNKQEMTGVQDPPLRWPCSILPHLWPSVTQWHCGAGSLGACGQTKRCVFCQTSSNLFLITMPVSSAPGCEAGRRKRVMWSKVVLM